MERKHIPVHLTILVEYLLHSLLYPRTFYKSDKLNTFLTEDIVVGGWGSAVLGRTFKIDTNGTDAFYLAGVGEKSYLSPDERVYLFGRLAGGSAFANSIGFNTYQEFFGFDVLSF